MEDKLILVDKNDLAIGTMGKLEAHQKGLLHRAFSVFLFNTEGEMLLQQRAWNKYHCAGLWSNACCSHQLPAEDTLTAANRRLMQELCIKDVKLQEIFSFTYTAEFENGLIEHEFDHILIGLYDSIPDFNNEEVAEMSFVSLSQLEESIRANPKKFTPWFKLIYERVFKCYAQKKSLLV